MTISMNSVRIPLLRALAAAPNGALDSDSAVKATLSEMGGDSDNKSQRTAVGNGKFELKLRGCIIDAARGTWAITDLGRKALESGSLPPQDRAQYAAAPVPRKAKEGGTEPPVKEEPAPFARVEEVSPAPEARGEVLTEVDASAKLQAARLEAAAPAPKRRLKVANAPAAPAVDIPEWLADDDIRAMAVESTECFGAWAAKASECGKCALAGWCRNAKASTLALLASKLTTETPAAPAPVKPSVAKLDEAVSTANAPEAPRAATSDPGGLTMKARHDGVCAVSGRPIKVGDAVRYKAGLGIYHAGEVPTTA